MPAGGCCDCVMLSQSYTRANFEMISRLLIGLGACSKSGTIKAKI
jgi:hypothetical protein